MPEESFIGSRRLLSFSRFERHLLGIYQVAEFWNCNISVCSDCEGVLLQELIYENSNEVKLKYT